MWVTATLQILSLLRETRAGPPSRCQYRGDSIVATVLAKGVSTLWYQAVMTLAVNARTVTCSELTKELRTAEMLKICWLWASWWIPNSLIMLIHWDLLLINLHVWAVLLQDWGVVVSHDVISCGTCGIAGKGVALGLDILKALAFSGSDTRQPRNFETSYFWREAVHQYKVSPFE